jgi:hypothetical protein
MSNSVRLVQSEVADHRQLKFFLDAQRTSDISELPSVADFGESHETHGVGVDVIEDSEKGFVRLTLENHVAADALGRSIPSEYEKE